MRFFKFYGKIKHINFWHGVKAAKGLNVSLKFF